MSFTEIIKSLTPWNSRKLPLYRRIIAEDPELVNDLDGKLAVELLRIAYRNEFFPFCTELSKLFSAYKVDVEPLEMALVQGDLQLIESLLKNGAKHRLKFDYSPAEYIFRQPNISIRKDILLLLLKNGFDPNFESTGENEGENALDLLTRIVHEDDFDAVELAKILINSGASVHRGCGDWTPLISSIYSHHIGIISLLIEKGADVNHKDSSEETPLIVAVNEGRKNIVRLLLENGANVNDKHGYNSKTALHYGCFHHHEKIIRLLIKNGAKISTEAIFGRRTQGPTPFSLLDSTKYNYDDCCKVMIKEFSKLSFENIAVSKKDMSLIMSNSKTHECFENCMTELDQMANTKLCLQFSYFSLLKMPIKKLALLTKNEQLLVEIKATICKFSHYQKDLREILEEAVQVKNRLSAVESRLKFIFDDTLPDIIVRKLVDNLELKDLPLE